MQPCPFCEEPMADDAEMCRLCEKDVQRNQGRQVMNVQTETKSRWFGWQIQCVRCERWRFPFRTIQFAGAPYCHDCYQTVVVKGVNTPTPE